MEMNYENVTMLMILIFGTTTLMGFWIWVFKPFVQLMKYKKTIEFLSVKEEKIINKFQTKCLIMIIPTLLVVALWLIPFLTIWK